MSTQTQKRFVNPFGPSTTTPPSTSMKDSTRDVTHPDLPELYDPLFLDKLLPKQAQSTSQAEASAADQQAKKNSAFMEALKVEANKQFTQNAAHGFASTLSPTLDAFNGLSQATDHADYDRLIRQSWEADPLLTVKLIFNLRSIHEGKSEREGFYRAWGWLYRNHPRTAIENLQALVEPLIERTLKEKKGKKAEGQEEEDAEGYVMDMEEPSKEESQITPQGMTHGYWKDLLNLLLLAAEGQLGSCSDTFSALHPTPQKNTGNARSKRRPSSKRFKGNRPHALNQKGNTHSQTRDARIAASLRGDEEKASAAKAARQEAYSSARENIQKLFRSSKAFKALYITVARLFADGLEKDVDILTSIADPATGDDKRIQLSFQISLCAKYAPSLSASHDRRTNIATAIAELLWQRGKLRLPYKQGETLSPTKAHDVRRAYSRWAISPLRRFLQIPETYMSAGKWNELPYKSVASSCMQKNKGTFQKHDKERFTKYLMDVTAGKRSISGGTLLPHTLLMEAIASHVKSNPADKMVIEAQWKTMVDKLKQSGALDNCLAVCDVSGSMGGLHHINYINGKPDFSHVRPIHPAVALTLVLSQVSREPWANSFITFSASPKIVQIDPNAGLVETAFQMGSANWGMNTDFNAVFTKLILPMAKKHNLSKDDMVKRLFVFSDMEFDQSTVQRDLNQWKTEHEKIVEAFQKEGYDVPEMVFWNLQGARGAKPVTAEAEGVSMMSGFSSNMMKVFMESGTLEEEEEITEKETGDEDGMVVVEKKEKKKMTPMEIMLKALNRPSYATLKVVD
ncbi:hypothetical protein CPB86DRAFT_767963 [Serendipita vermifera]|nr:hypothetical protein CPB86DRAFT_767963 [Serendipita vermifera]